MNERLLVAVGAPQPPFRFRPTFAVKQISGVATLLMAYLADVLERVVSGRTKRNELRALLPWDWTAGTSATITNQGA
jgi:hypothetical protein